MTSPKINVQINKPSTEKIIPKIAIVELLYFFTRLIHPVIRPIIPVIKGGTRVQQNIKETIPNISETIGKSLCFFEIWFVTVALVGSIFRFSLSTFIGSLS